MGSSLEFDERNPYGSPYREYAIKRIFPQVEIINLWDRACDKEWSKVVDNEARHFNNPTLFYSRDSFVKSYTGDLPLAEIPELPGFSGTELRKKLNSEK